MDPKVKEAYDKVMTSPIPPPSSGTQPSSPKPAVPSPTTPSSTAAPVTPSSPSPVNPVQPISPAQPSATTATLPQQTPPTPTIVAATPQPNPIRREPEKIHIGGTPHGAAVQKKSSGISPVIYIICAILFLAVYTVFWLKFFNVPIPFLPF